MIRALGGQTVGTQLVTPAGDAFTGAATVAVTGDAGVQTPGVVGGGAATPEGLGYYTYRPSAAETDFDQVAVTFTGVGAVPVTVTLYPLTAALVAQLGGPPGARAVSGLSLCRRAAITIGHLDPQETLDAGDAAFILATLNATFDDWNADREAVAADVYTTYDTVAGLTPHTLGPTGTWVTPQRPVTIDSAAVLTGSVRTAIRVDRDAAWWSAQPAPLTPGVPTDLYYNPTWPNGELYFLGVPAGGQAIALRTRVVLASIALATAFTLPPGYENAVVWTVAEAIAAPLGIAVPPTVTAQATQARARIFTANRRPTPTLTTHDAGVPGRRHAGGTYDYRTGSWH